MYLVDRVPAMRLRDRLQSWYQEHEAQLSQNFESVRFESSPSDRSPPSAWVELHTGERSGHLIAWDNGAVDAHVINAAGEDLFTKHWAIEDVDELGPFSWSSKALSLDARAPFLACSSLSDLRGSSPVG